MSEIITRPFGNYGDVEWTHAAGPSGVMLQSNIPSGHGGLVGVYLDFAPLQQILRDGQAQWSPYWRIAVREAAGG